MPTGAPSWGTGHVEAIYHDENGKKLKGRYQVHIPVRVRNSSDEIIIPSGLFARGRLNEDTGTPSFAMDVPATDDVDNSPKDWVVRIHFDFDRTADGDTGAGYQPRSETYYIHVPEGSSIDLSSVLPSDTTDPAQPDAGLIRGAPGGVAPLDADGDVTDARGVKVLPGQDGATGPKGDTGPAGPAGPQGPTGATGATGPAGATGPQGAKGETGDVGPTGATGATGPAGAKGDKGDTGPAGAKGDKGDPGNSTLADLPAGTTISRAYKSGSWEARGTSRTDLTCIYRAASLADPQPTDSVAGQDLLLVPGVLITDDFERSTSSNWGATSTGPYWIKSGGASGDYSTSDGVGKVALASTNVERTTYFQATFADADMTVTISPSAVASTGFFNGALLMRQLDTANRYLVWIVFGTDGKCYVDLRRSSNGGSLVGLGATSNARLDYAAGSKLKLRARLQGARLQAKLWPAADPEPAAWGITATDTFIPAGAGAFGTWTRSQSNNDNSDLVVSYDDFRMQVLGRSVYAL